MRSLLRTDTATNWAVKNPILELGEIGYDSSNKILKIGDGRSKWTDLSSVNFSGEDNSMLSISQVASDSWTCTADTNIANFVLDTIGFKPKIFILRANSGIPAGSSTKFYVNTVVLLTDNEFTDIQTDKFISPFTVFSSGTTHNATNNSNYALIATDTGVRGRGSASDSLGYLAANQDYRWIALG